MDSKANRVREFVERCVREAIQEVVFDTPESGDVLRKVARRLEAAAAYRAYSTYRLIELNDIMHWKKPKRVE